MLLSCTDTFKSWHSLCANISLYELRGTISQSHDANHHTVCQDKCLPPSTLSNKDDEKETVCFAVDTSMTVSPAIAICVSMATII